MKYIIFLNGLENCQLQKILLAYQLTNADVIKAECEFAEIQEINKRQATMKKVGRAVK